MKIANYELFPIETGRFALDGGAMFGIVPKPLWSKTNSPDERNRIELAARGLLLKGEGKIILRLEMKKPLLDLKSGLK